MSASPQQLFRAMKAAEDRLPSVGRSSRELGVRIEGEMRDLPVGPDEMVAPATGGMSVALDAAENLPKHRLPRSLGGEGRDPVFSIASGHLASDLSVRVDRHPHALVEPARPCPLEEFESALAATRPAWRMIS